MGLIGNYIFVVDSFSFNCQITDIQWQELNFEQISKKADEHKRIDGQYIYERAFISREEVEKYIKEQFYILTLEIKYEINISPGVAYKIELYPDH